jgi:hypothetical protein
VDRHGVIALLISMAVSERLFPNEGWLKSKSRYRSGPLQP